MADAEPEAGMPWFSQLSIIPPEYNYILRMISWFFMTLALAPIIPLAVLFLYDLLLWIWRLCMTRFQQSRNRALGPR